MIFTFKVLNKEVTVYLAFGRVGNLEKALKMIGQVRKNLWFQIIKFKEIYSLNHLLHSIIIATEKFLQKQSISRNLHVELLLPLAGTRQIGEAISKLSPEKGELVVLVLVGVGVNMNCLGRVAESLMNDISFIKEEQLKFVNKECLLCKSVSEKMLNATLGKSAHERLEKNIFMLAALTYMKM